ncbi:RsmB/NOP family class I SAM-dependent RNA methyltransferase [Tranquillimonas alkanivorans]|uniref:16S rRNA (Cytosine967-C5)-methyltransferase n=1 Tax=Tranquillimonas alkanivorans TaxID=441119 RepID=A0A1I5PNB6_9RHOB|nr:transcription antitermination factor NusB [Tranquillimonas alkanivorans]SFP35553.1 16S rRNA (cytosine967-C5)-methyltransferase [Tranquillimonas alkanivorans]
MAKPGLAPRRAAVALMDAVTVEGRLMSEALPGGVQALDPADRARAQRLATGALRWLDRSDRLLGPYLKRRPDPTAHNALRLAVFEMFVEQAAPHGVVDAAVSLMRARPETERQAGLVNAVLRNVLRAGHEAWEKLPPPRLPKWLRKPLVADYGKDVVAAIEAAHAAGAPLDLTPKDGDAPALAARLGGEALPSGSVRLVTAGQVSALPGFESGDWWVQDAAAAVPVRVLDPQPGERVLDMCAAPGGKTLQIAAAGAEVTALDISETRMKRVEENLTRCGLAARPVVADALEWEAGAPFDAVLLDAPCTATGTIRRHPDLPYAKDASDFPTLFELQAHMIDRALSLVKPGGRVVFCTCSLLVDEGEEQVRDALERHPGLTVDRAALERSGIDPAWIGAEGLRLRPDFWSDRGGMDGFFVTALTRP